MLAIWALMVTKVLCLGLLWPCHHLLQQNYTGSVLGDIQAMRLVATFRTTIVLFYLIPNFNYQVVLVHMLVLNYILFVISIRSYWTSIVFLYLLFYLFFIFFYISYSFPAIGYDALLVSLYLTLTNQQVNLMASHLFPLFQGIAPEEAHLFLWGVTFLFT